MKGSRLATTSGAPFDHGLEMRSSGTFRHLCRERHVGAGAALACRDRGRITFRWRVGELWSNRKAMREDELLQLVELLTDPECEDPARSGRKSEKPNRLSPLSKQCSGGSRRALPDPAAPQEPGVRRTSARRRKLMRRGTRSIIALDARRSSASRTMARSCPADRRRNEHVRAGHEAPRSVAVEGHQEEDIRIARMHGGWKVGLRAQVARCK